MSEVEFISRKDEVIKEKNGLVDKALEECMLLAEGYAKLKCPVDKGHLRSSISHKVVEDEGIVGTNMEYATYVELGTGIGYPGGRQEPWYYKDDEGKWHKTAGQYPRPYIKPSIAEHIDEYKDVIRDVLSGKS